MMILARAAALAVAVLSLACAGSSRRSAAPPTAAAAPASTAPAQSAGTSGEAPRDGSPPLAGAVASTGAAAPAPKLICNTERPTGSNIARRVCFREDELEEMRRQAKDFFQRSSTKTAPRR